MTKPSTTPNAQEADRERMENVAVLLADVEGPAKDRRIHADAEGGDEVKGGAAGPGLSAEYRNLVGEAVGGRGGIGIRTTDDSTLAYFLDPVNAVEAAVSIRDQMAEGNAGRPAEEPVRLRIAVHFGSASIEKDRIAGDVIHEAAGLARLAEAGEICVSRQLADQVPEGAGPWSFERMDIDDWDVAVETGAFRVRCEGRPGTRSLLPERAAAVPGEFRYRRQLVEGRHQPCFYCGSRKHRTADCPSKRIPEITGAFGKLGALSTEEINLLFSDYLKQGCPETDGSAAAAHQAFYDLKRVFQLRFFRCVWDAGNKSWREIAGSAPSGYRGGTAWVAQDCIRVSNHHKAGALLDEAMTENRQDYKIHCAAAFLNLEKGFTSKAEAELAAALRYARSSPEKMFVLFLLHRFAVVIMDDEIEARNRLKAVLSLDYGCQEAIYLDIVRIFRKGEAAAAMDKLEKLMRENRDYYIAALIDPDLHRQGAEISEMLGSLEHEARERAAFSVKEAASALKGLEDFLGDDNENVKAAKANGVRMHESLKGSGYFSVLEAERCAEEIRWTFERELSLQKKSLFSGTQLLAKRLDACSTCLRNQGDIVPATSFPGEMKALGTKMDELRARAQSDDPAKIREALALENELTLRVAGLERRLEKFENVRCLKNFAWKLSINTALTLGGAFLLSFLILPAIRHVFPGLDSVLPPELGDYQKALFMLVVIAGSALSLVSALKALSEGKR